MLEKTIKKKKKKEIIEIKIRIRLMAYDYRLLDLSCKEIVETVKRSGAVVSGPVPLPTKREVFTVLRGPHVDKKSREQFQIKTHKRLLEIVNPTAKTIDRIIMPRAI